MGYIQVWMFIIKVGRIRIRQRMPAHVRWTSRERKPSGACCCSLRWHLHLHLTVPGARTQDLVLILILPVLIFWPQYPQVISIAISLLLIYWMTIFRVFERYLNNVHQWKEGYCSSMLSPGDMEVLFLSCCYGRLPILVLSTSPHWDISYWFALQFSLKKSCDKFGFKARYIRSLNLKWNINSSLFYFVIYI